MLVVITGLFATPSMRWVSDPRSFASRAAPIIWGSDAASEPKKATRGTGMSFALRRKRRREAAFVAARVNEDSML